MSAALEHPIGPTTVDEWLTMDAPSDGSRLELILGYLHLSPAPSGQHQKVTYLLTRAIDDALRESAGSDFDVVPGVGIKISTAWRTGLIPDIVVLCRPAVGAAFDAADLVLAVEVWSPGNTRTERDTKMSAYAGARVPFFWSVDQDKAGNSTVTAHYLKDGRYVEELTAEPGTTVTIKDAAPAPVTFDPAEFSPR